MEIQLHLYEPFLQNNLKKIKLLEIKQNYTKLKIESVPKKIVSCHPEALHCTIFRISQT